MINTVEKNEVVQFKNGDFVLDVTISPDSETVWLNQKQIANLFGIDRTVVTRHIKNIFKSGELDENSMCANFAHMVSDGRETSSVCHPHGGFLFALSVSLTNFT